MTYKTPLRRTNLQFAHILRTEERTFIFVPPKFSQQPKIIAKGLATVYADFCFMAGPFFICIQKRQSNLRCEVHDVR